MSSNAEKLPNLIIAGVNKAGTTSLFSYLTQHPLVGGSSIKEACYFLPVRYGKKVSPIAEYQALFHDSQPCSVIMEATPGYFYGGKLLANEINNTLPDTKVIVLLRNPVDRLISFFNFMKSMLLIDQDITLEDYIKYCNSLNEDDLHKRDNNPYFGVEGGYYYKYIGSWMEQFDERLKILFFEDMKDDPRKMLKELCKWLKIDPDFYDDFDFVVENRTSDFKNRWLHKIAILVNKKFEVFFRRYPKLKCWLRYGYSLFNLKSSNKDAPQNFDMVNTLYKKTNLELVEILKEKNITNLPNWLKG